MPSLSSNVGTTVLDYSHLTQKALKFLQEVIIQSFPTVGRAARAIGGSVSEQARAARPTFRVTIRRCRFSKLRRFLDQMGVANAQKIPPCQRVQKFTDGKFVDNFLVDY